MKTLKSVILLCFMLFTQAVNAQEFSYIYIQGDKQTPFYVKLEGEMMPRYGKNYSIVSQLAPGPVNIQILFQQNLYPPQKFAIQVPENGHRGFLLMKKNETFALYDVQEQYYLQAGNKIEDDHVPANKEELIPIPAETKPAKVAVTKPNPSRAPQEKKPKKDAPIKTVRKTEPAGPQFIPDVELDNQHAAQPGQAKVIRNETAIVNSDCPSAITNDAFDRIFNKATDKDDRDRLKYMMEHLDKCFTTNQARILTKTLKTDAERLTFLKNVYSRISDQSAFPALEKLLTTEEWKSYFRSILPKQ